MTAPTRYREKAAQDEQPQVEVEVFTPTTWGYPGDPQFHVVRYPDGSGIYASRIEESVINKALQVMAADSGIAAEDVEKIGKWLRQTIPGREYIIDSVILERHFEVLPQTFRIQAWGQVFQRPMKEQLEAELDREEEADGSCTDVQELG
jgi:hypothetical protein